MKKVNKKLKDINLKELGLEKNYFADLVGERKLRKKNGLMAKEYDMYAEEKMLPFAPHQKIINDSIMTSPYKNNKSKFLPYINIVKKVEDDNGILFDREIDYEKKYYEEDFVPSKEPKKIIIPCSFKRFFSKTVKENILKMAVESPKKLPELVENAREEITQEALSFLDNQTDYQVREIICQPNNYSKQAKISKKASDWQKIEEVLKWIIDKSCEMQYLSTKWNKAGQKTFTREKELILIIDTTLDRKIEIEENRENEREKQDKKFPLPWKAIWTRFAKVIVCPLKNNFKFIIMDQKTLLGWWKMEEMKIKYDETNKLTYFLKEVRGGFEFLNYSNAVAFLRKD